MMDVSKKDWTVALILDILLGGLGIHRFYVGKIGTGILYLLTLGCFGIGVLIDLVLILCGSFTDATGAVLLSDGKKAMLHAQAAPTPTAKGGGVIHMNHIRANNTAQLANLSRFVALGIAEQNGKIVELAALKINDGSVAGSYSATALDFSPDAFVRLLGVQATLACYDIRGHFPAIADALRDIDASAEWDYVDLKEVAELRGESYEVDADVYSEAMHAAAYMGQVRAADPR